MTKKSNKNVQMISFLTREKEYKQLQRNDKQSITNKAAENIIAPTSLTLIIGS